MKNFTNNFKQFTSRLSARWLIMALMLLVGTSSAWAANEYGMQYLYVDCKNFTSYTQVNADMYWGINCSDKAEYKSAFPKCPNDNNVFYVDLKSLNKSSYTYYRAFEISQGSDWNDKKCFSVPENNKNNSIKISGWGAGSWSNFALTPSSVTLKVTSGTTGGTGTQNDPYLVEVGSQFTLSASSLTFNPADPKMVGRYYFGTSTSTEPTGTSTTSTQTASSTANTTKLYYVSVRGYYNGVYSSSYKTASVYVKTVASCTPSATLSTANFDAENNEIDLSGSIAPCGKELFYGFLWKEKKSDWVTDNAHAISGTGGSDNKTAEDKDFAQSWKDFTPGDTYQFTAYALDATTNPYTWYYSTDENNVIEVSTCTAATLSWANTFTGNMKVGDEVSNPASLSDAAAGSITYESSDPSVIEVDGNTLRVLKSGTATITASATPNTGFCSIESIEKEVNVTCDVVNTEDIRIEVVCTSGDNPYIWAWEPDNNNNNLTDGKWPGKAMKPEGNNVYSWEAKPTSDQSVSIIISKNKDGSNQTNNIDGLEIGKRYKFSYDPKTTVSGINNRYVYQLLEEDCLPPACVAPADPTISITPEGLCGEGTVTITVEDSHIAEKYQLYIVNNGYTKRGNAQEGKIFTETPSKTTTYVVKALNGKCTSNYSNDVTLTVYTQPTITQTKNTICKGEVINLNDCVSKVPDNATLTWYSDDAHGTQLSDNALNVSPETETTYYYQASIGGACTVDGSITLTVNDLPENVDFGTNNTASVCQNTSVNLTTLSAWTKDGQTIQWYSKGGDTYTPIDANQTITADCTFYAKAIFSNTGCESEGYTSFDITTLEAPDAPTLQPITVCPQVGFDLTEKSGWTAPDDGSLNISWYEKSDEEYVAVNSAKLLNQGITQATTYYARVQNKETGCYSAYVSVSVSVATVSKLTITPATGTRTPWDPISYTVNTDETFEMSYPDGLTSLPNIEITQSNNGKTYTYKIPRPTDWGTGNATPARTAKTFTIQAMLTGSSAECPSIGTATVTLQDEDNDNCTK